MKKMYRVFNELHSSLTNAKQVLKGWEHKETIQTYYVVGENLENFMNLDIRKDLYLARTEAEALEEMEY